MVNTKYTKLALIIAIVVVLNLFFNFALKVVYNEPQWNDFCTEKQVVERVETQEACLEQGGQWYQQKVPGITKEEADIRIIEKDIQLDPNTPQIPNKETLQSGYCNQNFNCQNNYQDAQESYEKKVFSTLIALGVISIIFSFIVAGSPVVATAFAFGGVLTFIWSSMRYWRFASEYLQVAILGIALLALIYLGVKKFK